MGPTVWKSQALSPKGPCSPHPCFRAGWWHAEPTDATDLPVSGIRIYSWSCLNTVKIAVEYFQFTPLNAMNDSRDASAYSPSLCCVTWDWKWTFELVILSVGIKVGMIVCVPSPSERGELVRQARHALCGRDNVPSSNNPISEVITGSVHGPDAPVFVYVVKLHAG